MPKNVCRCVPCLVRSGKVADAIIHHADVRRMLLTQAIAEGGRAMIYHAAKSQIT